MTAHPIVRVALLTIVIAGCATTVPQPSSQPSTAAERVSPAPSRSSRPSPVPSPSHTDPPDPARPEVHLEALAEITDRHGGNRAAGSTAYHASVEYVAEVLATAGYGVTIEPFEIEAVASSNVIAEMAHGADEVVVLGAHLDSVAAGPGINDNASAVAALLAVAEALPALPTDARTVRFAFWGAEEAGPFGSRAYVEALGAAERAAIVAYLNFDMLGSPNAIRFVYDESSAPPGSHELTRLFAAHFEAAALPWAPIDLEGDSDHGPFSAAGIPTGGLFSGGIEPVTDEQAAIFGAVAGEPADPCSHLACDTLENVDFDTLEEMTRAISAVLLDLAVEP